MKTLTCGEITTVISRFQSSIDKLERTGDYPERVSDQKILRKLIDMEFTIRRGSNREKKNEISKTQL